MLQNRWLTRELMVGERKISQRKQPDEFRDEMAEVAGELDSDIEYRVRVGL